MLTKHKMIINKACKAFLKGLGPDVAREQDIEAEDVKAGEHARFIVQTRAGELKIHLYGDLIACRFANVEAAKKALPRKSSSDRLNPYTGKWNFEFGNHIDPYVSASEFIHELRNLLKAN